MCMESPGNLAKIKTDLAGLGWSLTLCGPNKLPGATDAAGPGSPPTILLPLQQLLLLPLLGLHPHLSNQLMKRMLTPKRQRNLLIKPLFLCHLHYSFLYPPGPLSSVSTLLSKAGYTKLPREANREFKMNGCCT